MTINIKDYLSNTSLELGYEGDVTERDIIISTIIAFATVAKADNHLEPEEINALLGIIVREFDVKESEAAELLQIALLISEDKSKLDGFLLKINDSFDPLQKQLLMALVWRIILSDKEIEKFEATLAVHIRTSIGLTMEEAVRARKLAELDVLSIEVLKNYASE